MLKAFFLSFNNVDWSKTQAYSLGNIGQIRINLVGREPEGCVEPGAEYERVVENIIAGLNELRDPHSGELVIESVYRNPQVYQGKAAAEGADILFLPRRLEYFGFGEYEFADNRVVAPLKRGISGTHRMNGIGIAWGKPIRSGKLKDARLEDFAPTILHLLGLPVPAHMDGRPMLEVLAEEAGLPRVQYGPGWEDGDNPELHLSIQEEDTIRQRLRDLGYVA
jgi:predicted AlkP superfamily phosphohydrolase/phosphomutase